MSSKGLAEIPPVGDDAERSARFYEGISGPSPETPAHDDRARFRAGGPRGSQRAALREGERPGEPPGGHLRVCGVETNGPTRFDWMRAASHYFYDPGGNLLEIWPPDPGNDDKETD